MAPNLQFVHLSDIHIGQDKFNHVLLSDVRRELIEDIKILNQKFGAANFIIITGDTAFSGKKEEYHVAGNWISQLCNAVGCLEENVFIIPGNHDVERNKVHGVVEDFHSLISSSSLETVDKTVEKYLYDEGVGKMVIGKFENYLEFAGRYGRIFDSCQKSYWSEEIPFNDETKLRMIGLNTALGSWKGDRKGSLILGQSQYIIPREKGVEYLVLLHHPLDWLIDGTKAEEYLLSRARVLLFGHEHESRIIKNCSNDGFESIAIYSGAANLPSDEGYEYRYNWINISLNEASEVLEILIKPRIWQESVTRFVPDKAIIKDGSDSILHTLRISQAVGAIDENNPSHSLADDVHTLSTSVNEVMSPMNNEPPIFNKSDDRYRRLQFLFWKKLDRQQRIQVLIKLRVLPELESNVLANWLNHGLEVAGQKGKLPELWDEVMALLPVEQREINPFKK